MILHLVTQRLRSIVYVASDEDRCFQKESKRFFKHEKQKKLAPKRCSVWTYSSQGAYDFALH